MAYKSYSSPQEATISEELFSYEALIIQHGGVGNDNNWDKDLDDIR